MAIRKRNILIENITEENIANLSDWDLKGLRHRFINIYNNYFHDSEVKQASGISRRMFMKNYIILREEMGSRGIKYFRAISLEKEVEKKVFKSSAWLDIYLLKDMLIVPNYISISGDFVKSPNSVEKVDVTIRHLEEHRNEKFEAVISQIVKEQTRKDVNFVYNPKGPDSSYIPLFDLTLKSHEEIKKMKAVKEQASTNKPIDISIEKLSPAQRKECDEESAKIKENEKLPIAKKPHVFKPAKFTHPNGHPRCLTCGDEQSIGDVCNMTKAWYQKHKWDDEEAWTEERKKLIASGKLTKSFSIKKPEETETTIRIPVGPDCEVTATIMVSEKEGIQALYCGKIKKIRTYLFNKKKKAWTMAMARTWIKDSHKQAEKALNKSDDTGGKKKEKGTMFKILKVDKKQQIVGGIVYEPDEIDTQGDFTDAKEIEKAMYRFMEKYATDSNRIKINHKGKRYHFPIMESYIPDEDTKKGGQILKAGSWWLMIKVTNKTIWKMIENKELEGLSMGGSAKG